MFDLITFFVVGGMWYLGKALSDFFSPTGESTLPSIIYQKREDRFMPSPVTPKERENQPEEATITLDGSVSEHKNGKNLRFWVEGSEYAIEFQRMMKGGSPYPGANDNKYGRFRYPMTTVRVVEVKDSKPRYLWPVYRTFTVGCYHRDTFNLEKGRINALRALSKGNSLTREFKEKLWETYRNRKTV